MSSHSVSLLVVLDDEGTTAVPAGPVCEARGPPHPTTTRGIPTGGTARVHLRRRVHYAPWGSGFSTTEGWGRLWPGGSQTPTPPLSHSVGMGRSLGTTCGLVQLLGSTLGHPAHGFGSLVALLDSGCEPMWDNKRRCVVVWLPVRATGGSGTAAALLLPLCLWCPGLSDATAEGEQVQTQSLDGLASTPPM